MTSLSCVLVFTPNILSTLCHDCTAHLTRDEACVFGQAVAERESTLRAEQLSYSDAVFHVEMTQASEVAAPAVIPTGMYPSQGNCPPVANPSCCQGMKITLM